MEMTEIFWGMFLTTTIGFILALTRACYKSKCKNCSICFGLINIERDTEGEIKEDMELGIKEEEKSNLK